ncbi:hypothetical protein IAD21_04493 [Abditibacteriota bacterium]|nr:hypothetical protein IAD21_04493 [Abditibacteriota bacterium]
MVLVYHSRKSKSWKAGGGLAVALAGGMALNAIGRPVYAQSSGPTVLTNSIHVNALRLQGYWNPTTKKQDFSTTAWLPQINFRIKGPVSGGSQLSVEFTKPTGALWYRVDVPTDEIKEDEYSSLHTPRDSDTATEKKYTTGVGLFGFKIRLKNELTSQNLVLYSGKFKAGKINKANGTAFYKNRAEFYIDHDWELPIGHVYFYDPGNTVLPPKLSFGTWVKGQAVSPDLAGYLFYKDKQVASTKDQGMGASVDATVELNTVGNDKKDPTWKYWEFEWGVIRTNPDPDQTTPYFVMDKNPGAYTIKVLRNGKLCREAHFSVGDDGNIVDNGIATNNKIETEGILLPVKVLGTTDGTWNKLAWKTDTFYGHPLISFTAP